MYRLSQQSCSSKCSSTASSIPSGPLRNVTRSFQSGQISSKCFAGSKRPIEPVCCSCSLKPSCFFSSSRSCSPKITSFSSFAEWISTTSFISSRWSSERSIDMIGVMPLPALMKSSFSGISSGSMKSPSTPPSPTIVPTRACAA